MQKRYSAKNLNGKQKWTFSTLAAIGERDLPVKFEIQVQHIHIIPASLSFSPLKCPRILKILNSSHVTSKLQAKGEVENSIPSQQALPP